MESNSVEQKVEIKRIKKNINQEILSKLKKIRNISNVNFPLILGTIIILSLLITIYFPKLLTKQDPYKENPFVVTYPIVNGVPKQKVEFPPVAPNSDYILGTDDLGRDNYARLVYGAKTTLFAALYMTMLRFLVALPMGIWAGLGGKAAKYLIKQFNTVFTAIPPLITCFIVLNISYISKLSLEDSIKAFAVVFTVVGWAKLANTIEQKTFEIYQEEFIEGKIAIGRSKISLALQTIVPHLVPSITSLFFLESALVLFLTVQLSVFYIFIGPRLIYKNDVRGTWFLSAEPEWAAMLSRASVHFDQGKYWASVVPALAFTYAIMGLNLLGEGLRIEFDKRTSLVVTWLSRIPSVLSPRMFIARLKRYKTNKRMVWTTATIYIVIAAILLVPPPKSKLQFEVDNVYYHIENLSQEQYDFRGTGSRGGYHAANYIADQLKKYGVEPLLGDSYFQDYPLARRSVGTLMETAAIEIGDKSFNLWEDFYIQDIYQKWIYQNLDLEEKEDEDNDDKSNEEDEDDEEDEKNYTTVEIDLELVDFNLEQSTVKEGAQPALFSYKDPDNPEINIISDINAALSKHKSNTILLEATVENFSPENINIYSQTKIWVNSNMAQYIKESGAASLKLKLDVKNDYYQHYGRNVYGVIRGSNNHTAGERKEYLMIGSGYDNYIPADYTPTASELAAVATSLEAAKELALLEEKPNHDIVFVFWDGVYAEYLKHENEGYKYHGIGTASPLRDQKIYYIDIGSIGRKDARQLLYRTATPTVRPEGGYEFITYVKNRLSELEIPSNTDVHGSPTNRFMYLTNKNSFNIHFNAPVPSVVSGNKDDLKNLNKNNLSKFGQLLLDIMINHSYGGKI